MISERFFCVAFVGFVIACLSSWACAAEAALEFSEVSRKPIPNLENNEWPRVPATIVKRGETAAADIQFVVKAKGGVSDVEIVAASDAEAKVIGRRLVSSLRFKPAIKDGIAVNCRMQMPIAWESGN